MPDAAWWRALWISASRRRSWRPFLVCVVVLTLANALVISDARSRSERPAIVATAPAPRDPLRDLPRITNLSDPSVEPRDAFDDYQRALSWAAMLFLTSTLTSTRRGAGILGETAAPRGPWRAGAALGDGVLATTSLAAALALFLAIPASRQSTWAMIGTEMPNPALLVAVWPFATIPAEGRRAPSRWVRTVTLLGLTAFATGSAWIPLFGAAGRLSDPSVTAAFGAWHLGCGLLFFAFVHRD